MFESLSITQKKILGLSAIGRPSKEIATETETTENTINTHLKNIKDKVKDKEGRNYKLSELRFLFLCEVLGKNSESIKHQIISAIICVIFILTFPYDHMDKRRTRIRYRKNEIESIANYIIL